MVMGLPSTCSGLAYCGVKERKPSRVSSLSGPREREKAAWRFQSPAIGECRLRPPDVVRLQVAMDHEVLVGKLDSLADPQEKSLSRFWDREAAPLAEAMDGNAIHILHDQIQVAFSGDAAIQQAGNIRMLQAGQNLAFLAESLAEKFVARGKIDQFDGDLLLELSVGAMRQIDGAHAAASQQAINLIRTNSSSAPAGQDG